MALSGATKSISADVDNWQGYFDTRAKEAHCAILSKSALICHFTPFLLDDSCCQWSWTRLNLCPGRQIHCVMVLRSGDAD